MLNVFNAAPLTSVRKVVGIVQAAGFHSVNVYWVYRVLVKHKMTHIKVNHIQKNKYTWQNIA